MLKTSIVYVDAFNLYYGCLKDTPFRWLDLQRLCDNLLPGHKVHKIKYFTAYIKQQPFNEGKHARQQIYLRALKTIPHLEIIMGYFRIDTISRALAKDYPNELNWVKVIHPREKGSDVNLAAHLVNDAYMKLCDCQIVITNDSDLKEPLKLIRDNKEIKKEIGLINPQGQNTSRQLVKYASFVKQIRRGVLEKSQFASVLEDSNGVFYKPNEWY